jgi:hypothetical protein
MSNANNSTIDQALFQEFPKMARLSKDCLITEKIDGTNAQILVLEDDRVIAGSRTRMITPQDDNFGFARWVHENQDEIRLKLGYGRHYGEWWGSGVQRRYGLDEKRFSLFDADRWELQDLPAGVHVVPVMYRGEFTTEAVDECLARLKAEGSLAAPGFMQPEGVVVYHKAAGIGFKKTFEDGHKWQTASV